MKNDPGDCESIGSDDFFDRTEKIDGPEVRAFKPTLQELIKLVKIHINVR
jgi:hypothetical protein